MLYLLQGEGAMSALRGLVFYSSAAVLLAFAAGQISAAPEGVRPESGAPVKMVTQYPAEDPVSAASAVVIHNPTAIDMRNLVDVSEPSLWQLSLSSDTISLADFSEFGLGSGVEFPAAAQTDWAYVRVRVANNRKYTLSLFVAMEDGGRPDVGNHAASGDFGLVMGGTVASGAVAVEEVAAGLYRISATYSHSASARDHYGLVRYREQSGKAFRVTGWQLEDGDTVTGYQRKGAARTFHGLILHGHSPVVPDPEFVASNKDYLDTLPFDGTTVYVRQRGGTNVSFNVMENTPMSYSQIEAVLRPLSGLRFKSLTKNFAIAFSNRCADFFDDWSTCIDNMANFAKASKDAGFTGIFFDNESYKTSWPNYPNDVAYAATYSLVQYQQQARLRGQQMMEAMVREWPDMVIIHAHGPYVSEPDSPSPPFRKLQSYNELLGPFFVGMVEGAGSPAQVVDGGELYALRAETEFTTAYNWRKYGIASHETNSSFIPEDLRGAWHERARLAYAVYSQSFRGRSMNPSVMRPTLKHALRSSDGWTWFYQTPLTFYRSPETGGASRAWHDAVWGARVDAYLPPMIDSVVNGASHEPGFSSGSWATISGANLSSVTRTWNEKDFQGNKLPTSLEGVSVRINGRPAYVYYVSPGQLNVLVPDDDALGMVGVEVTTPAGKSTPLEANRRELSPALFTLDTEDRKYVAALHADGRILGPPGLFPQLATQPAMPGDTVLWFGTGFGPTDPQRPAGETVETPAPLRGNVSVRVGGIAAQVLYAGLTAPGLYQLNIVVPEGLASGDHQVEVEIDGVHTPGDIYLSVGS